MNITEQQLAKFKRIYKEEFEIELTDEEAYEKGIKLLTLMKHVYKPVDEKDVEKLRKKDKSIPP